MTEKAGKSDLLSLTQLASKLHINRGTLSRKLSGLDHVAGPKGARLYPVAEVEALLDEEQDPELKEARLRKLRAEAELAELKVGRERGELCERVGVQTLVLNIFRAWRNRLAVTMPREISAQLHRAESPAHVAEVLQVEVTRMLNEFGRDHLGFINRTEGFEGGMTYEDACGIYDGTGGGEKGADHGGLRRGHQGGHP